MRLAPPKAASRLRRARGLDDALLPLINVVFLLMVFFLLVGRLGDPREVASPHSRADIHASAAAPQRLELRPGGRLSAGGQEFADGELAFQADAWRGQAVDVRAPGDAPADRVLRLLGVLRQAGVGEVRLLTVRAP